jgi:hypothetical protein
VLYRVFGHSEKSYLNTSKKYDILTCGNYHFLKTVLYIINRKIHGCLEIPDLFLVFNMISHSFAALTREIPCSTLEINLVFPRTHVLFSI